MPFQTPYPIFKSNLLAHCAATKKLFTSMEELINQIPHHENFVKLPKSIQNNILIINSRITTLFEEEWSDFDFIKIIQSIIGLTSIVAPKKSNQFLIDWLDQFKLDFYNFIQWYLIYLGYLNQMDALEPYQINFKSKDYRNHLISQTYQKWIVEDSIF